MTELPRGSGRWTAARWRLAGLASGLIGREWLIAVAFTVGLAGLGAALGIIPDIAAESWTDSRQRHGWLYGFGAVAVLFLAAGIRMWWHRNRLLHRRGTAYIIEELSSGWTFEDTRTFLSAVGAQFHATRRVPGPADLGADWSWPLDRRTTEWDRRVDELVRSFWAVRFNDDQDTANAIYVWAPWSVAVAFGHRAIAGRRGLELQVRQRPSFGRVGRLPPVDFDQPGHSFVAGGGTSALTGTVTEHDHEIMLRVEGPVRADALTGPITVLLLRTSIKPWGPLSAYPSTDRVDLRLVDGAGLGLLATAEVTLHEWRYQPAAGDFIGWDEYPALVAAAVDWICGRAAAAPGATVLLGANVPPEMAIGLGIHATIRGDWPEPLWPLVFHERGRPLVVPRLRLGLPDGG